MHVRLRRVGARQILEGVGVIVWVAAAVVTDVHESIASVGLDFSEGAPVDRNLLQRMVE